MITEQRHMLIMDELKKIGIVKVSDLVEKLNTSESTIRRDLSYLESLNYIKRVHGGAVLTKNKNIEQSYNDKKSQNLFEKDTIAKYAASLIENGDSIYIDSGTTTYEMIKYINNENIVVVTNGLSHVDALIERNINCYILGGKIKNKTKAVVGYEALNYLQKYRFDKCFIGTNGIHINQGFTTPDPEEASIKEKAIEFSKEAFVITDESKFGEVSFVKFADIDRATIITNNHDEIDIYSQKTLVKVVR